MKIVLVHNYLRSSGPSGENLAYQEERDLLREYGHEMSDFTVSNDDLEGSGWKGGLRAAAAAPWSFSAVSRLRGVLRKEQPQVVHVHNTFPLLSASVFYAARGPRCARPKFAPPSIPTSANHRRRYMGDRYPDGEHDGRLSVLHGLFFLVACSLSGTASVIGRRTAICQGNS